MMSWFSSSLAMIWRPDGVKKVSSSKFRLTPDPARGNFQMTW
jgi:hypothetical protein